MNRKKKYLLIDTETANGLDYPLVYDIGYVVTDNTGYIYEKKSFVIRDIFEWQEIMCSAYYNWKRPLYIQALRAGTSKLVSFYQARQSILNDMKKYGIDTVMAYNAHFDIKALNNTLRYITSSRYRWFFPYGTKVNCIWHMACQVLYTQKRYAVQAIENKWYSEKNNLLTSAEQGKNYIDGVNNFTEEHTGLADVLIETEIFVACVKKHKKMDRNINRSCWRIPTKKHKEYIQTCLA